jgi:hypothetical protein
MVSFDSSLVSLELDKIKETRSDFVRGDGGYPLDMEVDVTHSKAGIKGFENLNACSFDPTGSRTWMHPRLRLLAPSQ